MCWTFIQKLFFCTIQFPYLLLWKPFNHLYFTELTFPATHPYFAYQFLSLHGCIYLLFNFNIQNITGNFPHSLHQQKKPVGKTSSTASHANTTMDYLKKKKTHSLTYSAMNLPSLSWCICHILQTITFHSHTESV